jgi:hypothetical protein
MMALCCFYVQYVEFVFVWYISTRLYCLLYQEKSGGQIQVSQAQSLKGKFYANYW